MLLQVLGWKSGNQQLQKLLIIGFTEKAKKLQIDFSKKPLRKKYIKHSNQ